MDAWIVVTQWGARLVLLVLMGLSVWSFAIMIDRYKALKRLEDRAGFPDLKDLIARGDRAALASVLASGGASDASLKHGMLREAMRLPSQEADRIDRLVKSYLADRKSELEEGFTVLATLGSNAPFIGLFGTVLGIIQAFAVLGQKQNANASVMSGISEALIATAVGLFVAIPAVVAYNYFSRRLKLLLVECESLRDFYLSHMGQGG